MDRNQATGLILMSLLVLVYFQFFAPDPRPAEQQEPQPIEQTQPAQEQQQATASQEPTIPDSVAEARNRAQYGSFASLAQGEAQEVVLENNLVRITLSSKGAQVKEVFLKEFLTYDKQPLYLVDEESSQQSWVLNTNNGPIDLTSLYYQADGGNQTIATQDSIAVSFTGQLESGKAIRHHYYLKDDSYELGYRLQLDGLDSETNRQDIAFSWNKKVRKLEQNLKESREKTTVNFYDVDGDFDYVSPTSTDREEEAPGAALKWVAVKQKFFTTAIIADASFRQGRMATEINPDDTTIVKNAEIAMSIPQNENNELSFRYYFGPNNYQILKKITPGFSKNIDLGWPVISWFNKFLIIPIFSFLENYISNYGIIILILVLIIKLLLSPLSYKSYVSMAKTKVLKPELDLIKEKYPDDMQKQQSEQMQLYSKVGINPLSGCIPLVLQMPILLAMFSFFPNSIELRQESFLWAHDLSTYDSVLNLPFTIPFYGSHVSLFTLLMTASTIMITATNSQMSTVQGPMKTMQYMMPVMFLFFLNSYSSGLTFYYFVANLVTYGQQVVIRKFVDEDKIKAILEENKKKNVNKKKSKFQQRLEDAMKASQDNKNTPDTDKDKSAKKPRKR